MSSSPTQPNRPEEPRPRSSATMPLGVVIVVIIAIVVAVSVANNNNKGPAPTDVPGVITVPFSAPDGTDTGGNGSLSTTILTPTIAIGADPQTPSAPDNVQPTTSG